MGMCSWIRRLLNLESNPDNTAKPMYEENNLLLISSSPRVLQDALDKLGNRYSMSSEVIRLDNLDYAVVLKYKEVK